MLCNNDDIKLSALSSIPSHILSIDEQFASHFKVYPNPASNVVNIINSENKAVQQVTVYDISGLGTQNFENSQEIQLNVQNPSKRYLYAAYTNQYRYINKENN